MLERRMITVGPEPVNALREPSDDLLYEGILHPPSHPALGGALRQKRHGGERVLQEDQAMES
jgi:hypothetical protein